MRSLVNKIGEAQESTLPLARYLFSISFNIISAILLGTAYKISDLKRRELEQHLVRMVHELRTCNFVDSKPVWLSTTMSHVPYTKMAGMRSSMRLLREFIRERVKENQDTLEECTTRSFIDGYLKQMKEHKNDPHTHFRECHLLGCAMDFFIAGVFTPPLAAYWILLVCAQNPDTVQSRIHAEIDRTVGRNRQPAWKDRFEMPFTTASVWEILRWRTEGSLGMPRGVKEDIILGGFIIPKGTVVLPNSRGIKRSPELWKRPDDFDPTRFLTPDGAALIKKPEYHLPFSVGKRMCPAESLATVQIFLYTTCLLQKYSVHPEEGRQLPCLDPVVTEGNHPDIQKLRFVPRV
ncbi:cytochrome P450 2U1-like [Ixodes scapularis]|uniref:cytochrome P450 2U1-like n=1 Tax=Ixodes scapularis TaxID=6945 RepID=UPI001C38DE21|nr:cytochrome P450 2U1-like [Ixodes scapularis]